MGDKTLTFQPLVVITKLILPPVTLEYLLTDYDITANHQPVEIDRSGPSVPSIPSVP